MIYLDSAATTPVDEDVLAAMLPYFTCNFGNSQSQHSAGRESYVALLGARDSVARVFGCLPEEVYFLSGGTEAGNLAVKGVCSAHGGGHIIISALEHPCVYESALRMEKNGFSLTVLKPDADGIISPESVKNAMRDDTIFCSVMAVNNEIGTIQPVREIGAVCKERGVFYYCDCVQAVGVTPFPNDCASAFAVSAHKFYGPKGSAAMYIKKSSALTPLVEGGRQERGLRGGTVNVAGAVGLSVALKKAADGKYNERIEKLRDCFVARASEEIEGIALNGGGARSPSIANISFSGCDGENIVFCLDLKGICASTGSACSAGAVTPSRIVAAVAGEERAKSAVRFSFSKYNTEEEVLKAADVLAQTVRTIRGR